MPTYATCKIFKIHTGVFTGEPVCRNVAGVYYILDVSLPASTPREEHLATEMKGEREKKSNRTFDQKAKKNPVSGSS